MNKKLLRNVGAGVLAVLLAVSLAVGLIPSDLTLAADKTADLDTSTKYTESLGDNASTEYAGRIWTDKSVYEESATFNLFTEEGEEQKSTTITVDADNGEDFLVAYSALATSKAVQGETKAPIDVVFVIDISGSMSNADSGMDNGNSRIYNTVQAVNSSIDKLMAMNEYTRVSVVAFSESAEVLLPLDRYTKTTENGSTVDYFTLSKSTPASENRDGSLESVYLYTSEISHSKKQAHISLL